MKYIEKREPPFSLEEYKKTVDATFDDMLGDVKEDLKKALLSEQGFLCCYCGDRIVYNNHTIIEHLMPKGLPEFSHMQLDYDNLMCSCDGGEAERKGKCKREKKLFPSHCDDKKNDSILPLTPFDKHVENSFAYDEEGHIYGNSKEAVAAIEILNLDCSTIVNRRKAAIEPYKGLKMTTAELVAIIERLSSRNKDGYFEPYCFAVIYYIKHYLMVTAVAYGGLDYAT